MKKTRTKKIPCIFCLWIATATAVFIANIFINNFYKTNNEFTNISDLPESFISKYLADYSEFANSNNKENILIVTSMDPLKNTFNASSVIEAPNHQYFLQYDSETQKSLALDKFSKDETIKVSENNLYEFTERDEADESGSAYNSWGVEAMGLNRVTEFLDSTEAEDVTVAIIDTGLDMELFNAYYQGKVLETYNVLGQEEMTDEFGHGTHIAGTIAEATPDNVKIIPVKTSSGAQLYSTDIISAINYITYYHKADVINMSFGGPGEGDHEAEYIAIEAANENNIISVAAAGNDNVLQTNYPAGFDNTISIASVDQELNKSSFSNYGPTIDFSAPGTDIKSLMSNNVELSTRKIDTDDDDHGTISGTSMATPHAVSAIAILKSFNKDFSLENIKEILKNNVTDLGAKGQDNLYGYGFINFNNTTLCNTESSDCDEFGLFETIIPDKIEISNVVFTPYNYGSLTNILASTIAISTTNGKTIEESLGNFDYDEIEINGYDPYSAEEQTLTVRYAGLETNFKVTNPVNYELGWEYYGGDQWNNNVKLKEYKDHGLDIKTLYFPSEINNYPVTSLNSGCLFAYMGDGSWCDYPESNDASNYTTIVLPEELTNIGYVFRINDATGNGFSKLDRIISLADELTVGALSRLPNLHTIEANILFDKIFDSAKEEMIYYGSTFAGDKNLVSVTLSNNNTVIPDYTFYNCESLADLTIPDSIAEIGDSAFEGAGTLHFSGGDNLAKIGRHAFYRSALEEFYIPASLTEIGDEAFAFNSNLVSLGVSPDNPVFDSRDNSNAIIRTDENKLIVGIATTNIPNSVETLANRSFNGVLGLKEIVVPEGVTTIESEAFYSNFYLSKIKLPSSLESIQLDSVFQSSNAIFYVMQDSYALNFVQENNMPYVIIGETDPDTIGSISLRDPNSETDLPEFTAFETINSDNLVIDVYYYNEETKTLSEQPETITDYTVIYQDDLDSLRATSTDTGPFFVHLLFDTAIGYHNVGVSMFLSVNKATPTYEIPNNLTANPGQELSEIILPEGFSWMDETETISGAGDMIYYAIFTPEDTDNYEIIENIPITIQVATTKEKLIPEFNIQDIIRDDAILPDSNIISIANIDKNEYEISNFLVGEITPEIDFVEVTFSLRMSDELFESYYFQGGLQEKEFTTQANIIYSSSKYDGSYDGGYHTISFNFDISECTIAYSQDEGTTYDLSEIPTYKEIGTYHIYYSVTCNNHSIVGTNIVMIRGIIISNDILRGESVRLDNNNIDDLLEKVQVISNTKTTDILDADGETIAPDDGITLATGYSIKFTIDSGDSYIYGISIIGDTTGDGIVDSRDFSSMRQHLIGTSVLENLYLLASDISDDNQTNSTDLLMMKQYLLGAYQIGGAHE